MNQHQHATLYTVVIPPGPGEDGPRIERYRDPVKAERVRQQHPGARLLPPIDDRRCPGMIFKPA